MTRSLISKVALRINWAIRLLNRESRANGFPFRSAYVWNDGFQQAAYMNFFQVSEHVRWLEQNPLVARLAYIRDLETGRFLSPSKFDY
jgi:hypothetical protein